MPILPFKLNQDCRHHIPRQRHKVTNSLGALLRSRPAYDASLRQRGSLTVWFTDEAIAAWAAEPRTTRGGQPLSASLTSLRGIAARWYSPLAILTALTLRAVFRLAYRQAEGLIGSIVGLLGLSLRVPDHTTLSRRAATLEVPRPGNADAGAGSEPVHLLVDSTGLKLCGKGEWLLEKHGHGDTPVVAHAAPGRGRQHRPDRGLHAAPQRYRRRVASRSLARPGRGRGGLLHRRQRLRPGSRLRPIRFT